MAVQTPDRVKDAVFYQIFPDRFARSSRIRHPHGIQFKKWGSPPEEQGFHGGDLLGIVDKLGYLQELGVNALYLNPVFASASNHRYHTYDYYAVDPLLGGNLALRELLDACHARGMRVVLDGVFNHASRGFWPFHHVLETGGDSPYIDWFYISQWPLNPYPTEGNTPANYGAWWDLHALPKLNVGNPGVRDLLLDVAQFWIEFGADGWRLDVPEEIDDALFWQEFRSVVKTANPDAYLVGEIWHHAAEWLEGDRFDAVMNYVFSRAAMGFFAPNTLRTDYKPGGFDLETLDAQGLATMVEQMFTLHDWEVTLAQLNLLDSHDTARALWMVGEDDEALRLCTLFQMTMPGAPCVYYGNEVGMSGATDPYCRGAFPWHDKSQWNEDLLTFFRKAIALRHVHPVLRRGSVKTLYAKDGIYACLRELDNDAAILIFNRNVTPARISLDGLAARYNDDTFVGIWNRAEATVTNGQLSPVQIPARDGLVLTRTREDSR